MLKAKWAAMNIVILDHGRPPGKHPASVITYTETYTDQGVSGAATIGRGRATGRLAILNNWLRPQGLGCFEPLGRCMVPSLRVSRPKTATSQTLASKP